MRFLLFSIFTFFGIALFAQAPEVIPYQAVARDAAGQALSNATINARFTIHNGASTGAAVWQEEQTVTTSALGLFTVQLGRNIALSNVNWGEGAKFMQVEIDLGQGYVDLGTQQMLSVPYALYAGSVSLNVSATGDTLFVGSGESVIIPGISEANPIYNGGGNTTTGTTLHTCGAANVHNPDLTYGSMTDQEGNVYKTIVIGTQEWMAENLNTSIYRNGDAIPTGLDDATWSTNISGAWSYYNNDPSNACPYGKLYNWYACADARHLCPSGWHMPNDDEWTTLMDFLGGETVAGGKMKTVGNYVEGTGLWFIPNAEATNLSGFSGVPGGFRSNVAGYDYFTGDGKWWSADEFNSSSAPSHYLSYIAGGFYIESFSKHYGLSVRCLRD